MYSCCIYSGPCKFSFLVKHVDSNRRGLAFNRRRFMPSVSVRPPSVVFRPPSDRDQPPSVSRSGINHCRLTSNRLCRRLGSNYRRLRSKPSSFRVLFSCARVLGWLPDGQRFFFVLVD